MAVKRIGFVDNFKDSQQSGYGPGSKPYARSGPRAGSPYYQAAGAAYKPPATPKVNTTLTAEDPRVQASLDANPQSTMGPSPNVNYPAQAAPRGALSLEDPAIVSDPVLQKARKLAQGQRDDAATSALARKKQLAVQVGDAGLAREFGLDDTVAQTAAQNPLSILAAIRDQAIRNERDFNESTLEPNLFFSGYRGSELGELAKARLTAEAQAQARAREGFSGIESELLGAGGLADQMEMDAEAAAYARALEAGSGGEMVDVGAGAGGATGGGIDQLAAEFTGAPRANVSGYTPMPGEPTFQGIPGPVKPLDLAAILGVLGPPKKRPVLPGGGGSLDYFGI